MLTKTEKQIFQLIVLGDSNKEIANTLNISENTVKVHVQSIMRKKKVKSRAKLIANYYIEG